jgi:hypothetical protein
MSSPRGWENRIATLGASSSSHSSGNAEPPASVHSQPSTPSSRGMITLEPVTRRSTGKRPSPAIGRDGPDSVPARAIAPSGIVSGASSTPP